MAVVTQKIHPAYVLIPHRSDVDEIGTDNEDTLVLIFVQARTEKPAQFLQVRTVA